MTSTAADPLPSWNEGPAKQGILAFIARVTQEGSPDFLPLAERIAVHDNDGSLWPENPMPFQAAFAIDELNRRILTEPRLASDPMVQAALAGEFAKLLEGEHFAGLMQILALTHAGMTIDEFRDAVEAWSHRPNIRDMAGPMTNSPTNPCRNSCAFCGQMASRTSSFPVAARTSCASGWTRLRHTTRAGCRLDSADDIRTARQRTGADKNSRLFIRQRQGGQASRHSSVYRPATYAMLWEQ